MNEWRHLIRHDAVEVGINNMDLLFSNPSLRVERTGLQLWCVLARPPGNTFVAEVFEGLQAAMDVFEAGADRVLVFTGEGASFSKGADLQVLKACQSREQLQQELILNNTVLSRIARSRKPTIAAINGSCFGGGLELALCCHFRVVREKTRLGFPEIWGGMIPGLGGVERLCRLIGSAKALELIAFGELVGSEDALRLGIVHRVYPRASFDDDIRAFAQSVATVPAEAMDRLMALCALSSNDGEENIRRGWEAFRDIAPWLRHPPDAPVH